MKRTKPLASCAALAGLLFCCPQGAGAEETAGTSSVNDYLLYQGSEITVTAQKREESVQDVPAALTVLTEQDIEDAGVETVSDIADLVPNLVVTPDGSAYIRGISPSIFNNVNPVVVYVDGVPMDGVQNFNLDLVNIERVEVLRGPQGTLYGKNAIGGVINVVTRQPGNEFESRVGGYAEGHDAYSFNAYVSGPVVEDRLFFSLAGKYDSLRGYMESEHSEVDYYDGAKVGILSGKLRWLPSETFELNLHASMSLSDREGFSWFGESGGFYHETILPGDRNDMDYYSAALNAVYHGENFEIHSVSTYWDREYAQNYYTGFLNDGSYSTSNFSSSYALSQELRIQSLEDNEGVQWMGGLYFSYGNEDYDDYSATLWTESLYGFNMKSSWPGDRNERTMAVFGQVTVPLASSLDFTAGLRYENIKKEVNYRSEITVAETGALLASPVEWHDEDDWDALLPKGVLSWSVSDDLMLYGSIAKGYLAGGINAYTDDKETAKFDEQTSLNYELGAKIQAFDGKLQFHAALFYIDINDMHVYEEVSPLVYVASNSAKAHSQGLELDARISPVRGLDLVASLGLLETRFDDYGAYTGKTPVSSPEYTANLQVQYRHASGVFARVEMEGYGKTFYDEANTVERDPFEIYHARIGYERDSWGVYLYGRNLFDKKYLTSQLYGRYLAGEPRTLGVSTWFWL